MNGVWREIWANRYRYEDPRYIAYMIPRYAMVSMIRWMDWV